MRLGSVMSVPLNMEILVLALIGIICTSFDTSIFNLHSDLREIWATEIPQTQLSLVLHNPMKVLLTSIVVVRSCTSHLHLACYIIMLYPVLCSERPSLLLPWLVVGAIKQILTSLLSLSAGLFVCASMDHIMNACTYLIVARFIELAPALYLWILVHSLYREIKHDVENKIQLDMNPAEAFEQLLRRRRTRLMESNGVEKKPLVQVPTPRTYIAESRSLDALMSHIPSAVDVTIYPEMAFLTPAQKTQHLLGLTDAEVNRVRRAVPHAKSAETLLVVGPNASSAKDEIGKALYSFILHKSINHDKDEKLLRVVDGSDGGSFKRFRRSRFDNLDLISVQTENESAAQSTQHSINSFSSLLKDSNKNVIKSIDSCMRLCGSAETQTATMSANKSAGNTLEKKFQAMQTDSDDFLGRATSSFRNPGALFIKLLRRGTKLSISQSNISEHFISSNASLLNMDSDGTVHALESAISSELSFFSAKSKFSLDSYNIVEAITVSSKGDTQPLSETLYEIFDVDDSPGAVLPVGNRAVLYITAAVAMKAALCLNMFKTAWDNLRGLNQNIVYNTTVSSTNMFGQQSLSIMGSSSQGPADKKESTSSNKESSISSGDSISSQVKCSAVKILNSYGRPRADDIEVDSVDTVKSVYSSEDEDGDVGNALANAIAQLKKDIKEDRKRFRQSGAASDKNALRNARIREILNRMKNECQKCKSIVDKVNEMKFQNVPTARKIRPKRVQPKYHDVKMALIEEDIVIKRKTKIEFVSPEESKSTTIVQEVTSIPTSKSRERRKINEDTKEDKKQKTRIKILDKDIDEIEKERSVEIRSTQLEQMSQTGVDETKKTFEESKPAEAFAAVIAEKQSRKTPKLVDEAISAHVMESAESIADQEFKKELSIIDKTDEAISAQEMESAESVADEEFNKELPIIEKTDEAISAHITESSEDMDVEHLEKKLPFVDTTVEAIRDKLPEGVNYVDDQEHKRELLASETSDDEIGTRIPESKTDVADEVVSAHITESLELEDGEEHNKIPLTDKTDEETTAYITEGVEYADDEDSNILTDKTDEVSSTHITDKTDEETSAHIKEGVEYADDEDSKKKILLTDKTDEVSSTHITETTRTIVDDGKEVPIIDNRTDEAISADFKESKEDAFEEWPPVSKTDEIFSAHVEGSTEDIFDDKAVDEYVNEESGDEYNQLLPTTSATDEPISTPVGKSTNAIASEVQKMELPAANKINAVSVLVIKSAENTIDEYPSELAILKDIDDEDSLDEEFKKPYSLYETSDESSSVYDAEPIKYVAPIERVEDVPDVKQDHHVTIVENHKEESDEFTPSEKLSKDIDTPDKLEKKTPGRSILQILPALDYDKEEDVTSDVIYTIEAEGAQVTGSEVNKPEPFTNVLNDSKEEVNKIDHEKLAIEESIDSYKKMSQGSRSSSFEEELKAFMNKYDDSHQVQNGSEQAKVINKRSPENLPGHRKGIYPEKVYSDDDSLELSNNEVHQFLMDRKSIDDTEENKPANVKPPAPTPKISKKDKLILKPIDNQIQSRKISLKPKPSLLKKINDKPRTKNKSTNTRNSIRLQSPIKVPDKLKKTDKQTAVSFPSAKPETKRESSSRNSVSRRDLEEASNMLHHKEDKRNPYAGFVIGFDNFSYFQKNSHLFKDPKLDVDPHAAVWANMNAKRLLIKKCKQECKAMMQDKCFEPTKVRLVKYATNSYYREYELKNLTKESSEKVLCTNAKESVSYALAKANSTKDLAIDKVMAIKHTYKFTNIKYGYTNKLDKLDPQNLEYDNEQNRQTFKDIPSNANPGCIEIIKFPSFHADPVDTIVIKSPVRKWNTSDINIPSYSDTCIFNSDSSDFSDDDD